MKTCHAQRRRSATITTPNGQTIEHETVGAVSLDRPSACESRHAGKLCLFAEDCTIAYTYHPDAWDSVIVELGGGR